MQNWVILGETIFEIIEELISCRTNEHNEAYPNSAKRLRGVSPKTAAELIDSLLAVPWTSNIRGP